MCIYLFATNTWLYILNNVFVHIEQNMFIHIFCIQPWNPTLNISYTSSQFYKNLVLTLKTYPNYSLAPNHKRRNEGKIKTQQLGTLKFSSATQLVLGNHQYMGIMQHLDNNPLAKNIIHGFQVACNLKFCSYNINELSILLLSLFLLQHHGIGLYISLHSSLMEQCPSQL